MMLKRFLNKLVTRVINIKRDKKNRKGLPYLQLLHYKETRKGKVVEFVTYTFMSFVVGLSVAGALAGSAVLFLSELGFSGLTVPLIVTSAILGSLTFTGLAFVHGIESLLKPSAAYAGKVHPSFLVKSRDWLSSINLLLSEDVFKGDAESLAAAQSAVLLWDNLAATYASWVDKLNERQLEDLYQALKTSGKLEAADESNCIDIDPLTLTKEDLKRREDILEVLKPLEDQATLIDQTLTSLAISYLNAKDNISLINKLSLSDASDGTHFEDQADSSLPIPVLNTAPHSKLQSQIEEITDVNLAQSKTRASLKSLVKELM